MTIIRLTEAEMYLAGQVASMRQMAAMRKGYTHRWGDVNRGWINNLLGCFGELAVAKYLDRYWHCTVGKIDGVDVGGHEVRYNSYGDKSLLRIYDQDKPDKKYILVTGEPPEFHLRGWLFGSDGMLPEYKDTPLNTTAGKECFWVPMENLKPMSDL